MGGFADMNDIARLMRSPEGKAHLEEIRKMLEGRFIKKVEFTNEVHFIATTLVLDDGERFFIAQPSLEIDAIREQFAEVLEREYYADYPERSRKDKGGDSHANG